MCECVVSVCVFGLFMCAFISMRVSSPWVYVCVAFWLVRSIYIWVVPMYVWVVKIVAVGVQELSCSPFWPL